VTLDIVAPPIARIRTFAKRYAKDSGREYSIGDVMRQLDSRRRKRPAPTGQSQFKSEGKAKGCTTPVLRWKESRTSWRPQWVGV